MTSDAIKSVKLTLMGSIIRRNERVKATVRGLGLRHRHHSRVVELTPENVGMIKKVSYLLIIEEV